MENVTNIFSDVYLPKKALVVFQSEDNDQNVYIEAYDMSHNGKPINAHPLSVKETQLFAETLNSSVSLKNDWLKSKGLLPDKLLYVNPGLQGFAVWHTPEQQVDLLFKDALDIPCGKASVPPLVWKADKKNLYLYAIKTRSKPSLNTPLFFAPFFNVYGDSRVCMGTVDTGMDGINSLEDFIGAWERSYWGSYFSHMISEVSPIQGNIVQVWQEQLKTGQKFPLDKLKKDGKTINDILT
jgi:PRTRC genetic system protein B